MTTEIEFQPWPKIARLNREITVTEKIDGSNAAILINEDGEVAAQSRNRLLSIESDNFGFARWVHDHADDLARTLQPGRHFGEWWGSGIQRGYGLPKGEKRFSLFNTARWKDYSLKNAQKRAAWQGVDVDALTAIDLSVVPGLDVVPILFQGQYKDFSVGIVLETLRRNGSFVSEGFMNPEGIVIYHSAANQMFKVTLEGDEEPKSRRGAA